HVRDARVAPREARRAQVGRLLRLEPRERVVEQRLLGPRLRPRQVLGIEAELLVEAGRAVLRAVEAVETDATPVERVELREHVERAAPERSLVLGRRLGE